MIWLARPPSRFATSLVRITVFAAISCAVQSRAETGLQASYTVGPKTGATAPAANASTDVDAPLKLEYELITRIERMTDTANELRTIVESMPGPSLPAVETQTSPPLVHYATPIAETMARLDNVEHLIADITRIIQAMPIADNRAVAPSPSMPSPRPVVASPAGVTRKPVPSPIPAQPPAIEAPMTVATVRAIWLLVGGLVAAALAVYLRRRFLRSRPSRNELASAIETPSLRDDALELADVMTSMGLADGAAQTLLNHINTNPRQALTHWLKLLEVYRKTGKQAEFAKAAEQMRTAFNVKPSSWSGKGDDESHDASLENYRHVAAQLKKLWPSQECSEYLLSLLADNRDGKRAGFPLPVVEEIVLLLAILRSRT